MRLSVVDGPGDLVNRSLALHVAAVDHGRPPLQSFAVLHIILTAAEVPASATHSEEPRVAADSTPIVLAGVLSSFVVVALAVAIAILVVCRKTKQQQQQQGGEKCREEACVPRRRRQRVQMELSESSEDRCTSSTSVIGARAASCSDLDVDAAVLCRRTPPTIDPATDHFHRHKVCTHTHTHTHTLSTCSGGGYESAYTWASAHRGRWGLLTPLEKWMIN